MSQATYDIFLSYSFKDEPIAERLAERLKDDGFEVWFAKWHCRHGMNLASAVGDGLNQAALLIFCMSPRAVDSEWLEFELSTFRSQDLLGKKGTVVPLLLEDFALPKTWSGYYHIDFRSNFEEAYEPLKEHCRELLAELARAPATQGAAETPRRPASPASAPSPYLEKRRAMFPRLARPAYLQ